jgi:uncharacterized membrane protein
MTDRSSGNVHSLRPEKRLIEMDALASGRSIPMLRKAMIVLATAAALTGGLTADAFARGGGGGGHMGGGGGHIGGFGGVHMGGGFGGPHVGGGFAGPHMGGGVGGPHMGGGFRPHFAARRGRFGVGAGDLGLYDSCDYTSLYYNPDPNSCYLDGSPLGPLNP